MIYEMMMSDGSVQTIRFNPAEFKNLKVWEVYLEDGREAMLFKCGEEWMQRNEDQLDAPSLIAIGQQIDFSTNGT